MMETRCVTKTSPEDGVRRTDVAQYYPANAGLISPKLSDYGLKFRAANRCNESRFLD